MREKETAEYKEGALSYETNRDLNNPYSHKTDSYRLWHLGWLHSQINSRVGHILEKYKQEKF